jgi:hypothetical protein
MITNFAQTSTEDLKEALIQSVQFTAKHLQYMANIWCELERRGEDLSALRTELTEFLPLIAKSQLSAEAALQFAGQKVVLNHLPKLSLEEQTRLAHGGTVKIIERDTNGGYVVKEKNLSILRADQVNTVFGPDGLRTVEEQLELKNKEKEYAPRENHQVKVNKDGFLKVGNKYIAQGNYKVSVKDILKALNEYYQTDLEALIRTKDFKQA